MNLRMLLIMGKRFQCCLRWASCISIREGLYLKMTLPLLNQVRPDKELDGADARLADYFDVITGISIEGLVTTMLIAPNENNCPLFAAKDIMPIYLVNSPKIFPQMRFSIFSKLFDN